MQLRNSLAAALQREHNVQGDKREKNILSFQPCAAGRVAIQPMTRASAAPRTTWPLRASSKKKHGVAMSNKGKRKGKKRSAGRPEEQGRIVLSEAEQEILCFHTSLEGRQAARMPIQNLDTMIVHGRGFPVQYVTSTPPPTFLLFQTQRKVTISVLF